MRSTVLSLTLGLASLANAQGIGGGIVVEDEATLINQRLGAYVDRNTTWRDENGVEHTIGHYLDRGKPVVLNMQFFSCPSLCGPVLNGLVSAMDAIDLTPGKDMTVLSVSFDHREQTRLGVDKKASVFSVYPSDKARKQTAEQGWHFLTSDSQKNIRKLTESVGYGFRWNETRKDFDHKACMIFIAPSGKITRYLRGAAYDEDTFRLAVIEASEGTVGSAMDRFVLSCYSYDPMTGTYSTIGPTAMAIGGALTLAGLFSLLFVLIRRERRAQVAPVTAS